MSEPSAATEQKSGEALLRCENLTKTFLTNKKQTLHAVTDVTLGIAAGSTVRIGTSGANMSMRSSVGFQSAKSATPQTFAVCLVTTSSSSRRRTIGFVSSELVPRRRK